MSSQATSTKVTRGVKGKGTVHLWGASKSPNTKYRAKLPVTLPDGKKKTVYGYGPNKTAAHRDLDAKVAHALARHPSSETLTFHQALVKLLEAKKMGGKKQKTLFNDADLYKRHVQGDVGDKPLAEISLEDLQTIQYRLIQRGKYRTVELVTILLKQVFKHAVKLYRKDILEGRVRLYNVAEDLEVVKRPPSAVTAPPKPWTDAQLARFLAASEARYAKSVRNLLHPLFMVAVMAGLRRGELLNLRWDALTAKEVTVRGEPVTQHYLSITRQYVYHQAKFNEDTPKSRAGIREVPIGPALLALLEAHCERLEKIKRSNPDFRDQGLILCGYNGNPIEPRNIYRARDELIEQLALPPSTLHQMRKVFTTYVTKDLIRRGLYSPKIVQRLLGHERPDVALETYSLVMEDDYNQAALNLDLPPVLFVEETAEEVLGAVLAGDAEDDAA